jgi:DNA-binding NtrC family response regulator
MSTILIVDDLKTMREQYAYDIKRKLGGKILTASNGKEALDMLSREDIDVVVADIEMPVMNGLQFLDESHKGGYSDIPVIVYTAEGNFERCVQAVKLGAYNFFDKGEVTVEQLVRVVENALEQRRLVRENQRLLNSSAGESVIIGTSNSMVELRRHIERISQVPSNVLILGESGTGKELVAKEIHRLSARAHHPFVAVNSAALPENLVESELFGFEKGAFTGAVRSSKGKFEMAHGGTIFLDEIGDMPLTIQAKLLRVLEESEITRLGGEDKSIKIDVRIITATHRDIESEIGRGTFRQDLYFRICTHVIRVAPLRERKEDVGMLAYHFVERTCRRFGIEKKNLHPDTISVLMNYDWKMNNVRELENIIERMIIQCDGDELKPIHIPSEIRRDNSISVRTGGKTFQELKKDSEKYIILNALRENDWHITNTAKSLGIANHSNLIKMMKRLGITRPDNV